MRVDEVCPQCGAERPSWLGSSHRTHDWKREIYDALVCEDGQSPEKAWRTYYHPFMSRRLIPAV